MIPEELQKLTKKYLNGEMDTFELKSFESILLNDSNLIEYVNEEKMIRAILIEGKIQQLKIAYKKGIPSNSNSKSKWFFGGAILLTSIGIATYFISKNTANNPQEKTIQAIETIDSDLINERVPTINTIEKSIKKQNKIPTNSLDNKTDTTTEKENNSIVKHNFKIQTIDTVKTNINTETKTTNTEVKVAVNNCSKIVWHVSASSHPTCIGKSEGIINLNEIKGGTEPFTTKMLHKSGEHEFDKLASGTYNIEITDAHNCKHIETVTVHEINCKRKLEYLFQPEKDEELQISLLENEGSINIHNNSGKILYKSTFQDSIFVWNGADLNGQRMANGVYIITIEYANKTSETGYVTIY